MTKEKFPLNERDRLVEELRKLLDFKGHPIEGFYRLADFIIADKKRIMEPVVRALNTPIVSSRYSTSRDLYRSAMNDSLRLAGLDKEKI